MKTLRSIFNLHIQKFTYDFKLKGGRIFKGRYLELLPPPPPLCDLTLKWSNFFSIDGISGLEMLCFNIKFVYFLGNFLTLSVFHDFNQKTAIFCYISS